MILILSSAILFSALILLLILSIIDLRTRLLPNIYVFPFGVLGVIFNLIAPWATTSVTGMGIGFLIGAGLLMLIRCLANAYYKMDTLGLGDVKLMGAAGLWLGPEHICLALSIGAGLGVMHGLVYAAIKRQGNLMQLSIPAGPGFIGGIILTFILKILWT